VQGRLRGEPLTVRIESSCALCGAPLTLEMDSELEYRTLCGGSEPMLFHPFVDFAALAEPSIIDAF
jgi:hypothetical protein